MSSERGKAVTVLAALSEIAIAAFLVVMVSVLMSTAVFLLSWLVYRKWYGVSLLDFIQFSL
jgi:hypothetical protein